jgi:hypothetical protein
VVLLVVYCRACCSCAVPVYTDHADAAVAETAVVVSAHVIEVNQVGLQLYVCSHVGSAVGFWCCGPSMSVGVCASGGISIEHCFWVCQAVAIIKGVCSAVGNHRDVAQDVHKACSAARHVASQMYGFAAAAPYGLPGARHLLMLVMGKPAKRAAQRMFTLSTCGRLQWWHRVAQLCRPCYIGQATFLVVPLMMCQGHH